MSTPAGIIAIGIDRGGAGQDAVGRLQALEESAASGLETAPGQGWVMLSTCHRVEVYFEGFDTGQALEAFASLTTGRPELPEPLRPALRCRRGEAAGRHLLRVAAGLESAVLGEDQILSQLRRAYRLACEAGTASLLLHRLFHAAFRTGKQVRSRTSLARGGRSMAGAAVAIAREELGGLRDKTVMVIGLGEMGALAAERLSARGVGHLLVCNRTLSRAEEVAARIGARVLVWPWRGKGCAQADAVVCATGAGEPVIEAGDLRAAAEGGCRLAIDLSVPSNLPRLEPPPAGFRQLDVEALAGRLALQRRGRDEAVSAACAIVEQQLLGWVSWVEGRDREDRAPAVGICRPRRGAAS